MRGLFTGLAIASAITTIVFIIMQQKGVGLGSAFGGESFVYKSRRGAEKIIYWATILSAITFAVSAFVIAEIL